jgi:hypothetical protein
MNEQEAFDAEQAGTGFMQQPAAALEALEARGYTASFATRFDHLEAQGHRFGPADFTVDESFRFENTSDPSDQSMLFAISCISSGLKGTLLESYGLYAQDHSPAMLDRLGHHLR